MSETITGTSIAAASSGGSPKPSYEENETKASRARDAANDLGGREVAEHRTRRPDGRMGREDADRCRHR